MTDDSRTAFPVGRMTRQRRVVADAVCSLPGAFTVEDLAERIRATEPAAGAIATVYRAVSAMVQSGFITRVGTRDGSSLYARCGVQGHHHHVVCDSCGKIATADCPLPPEPASSAGFRITRHEVTLYGLCPECDPGSDGE